ncbi:cytochrome P450 [Streptomyces sp. DSM 44917]|uniref:Cytochrome P450 n=1 Tax=Streptomyces boetiae TaxID=3075541 RepID=A0ABU2L2G6_9ACTN|nr:cytochrome P450 [Streptomyces sp. DSM 44917]MDT0305697.1 cytochrome P450 [Streptomyces sp. DSM 44917]
MTDTELLFNPLEPGFTDDPYPAYRRLRAEDPVHEHPFGFWLLTSHEDVSAILRSGLSVDARHLGDGVVREQIDTLDEDGLRVIRMSMLDADPPDHTRLRSLVTKAFTRRAVAALEPRITELVDAALDTLADAGHGDLVETLAFPLPFEVISGMLGMPPTDAERIRRLSGKLVLSLEAVLEPEVLEEISRAGEELTGLTRELIAWKRANPADDLLTALIAAEEDGDRLSDDELIAQVILLYVAGHETTVNLIANGTVALLRHPDQLAALRENPVLAANAVEELLRYDSPVQQTRRITLAPYSVGGREIPAHSFVIACLASANRDESVFGPDAELLRLDRENARQHVSFGAGPHHCLGAILARLEGRVALERLVRRFPRLSLDGEVEWNGRINLRGPARLPVAV